MGVRVSELFEEPLAATDEIELRGDAGMDPAKIKSMVLSKIGEAAAHETSVHPQAQGERAGNRAPRRRTTGVVVALIALSALLLCGFTYALSTGWLTIADDAGHEVMRVQPPNAVSAERTELEDRVQQTVDNQLQRGEAALIVIGQADIDAVKRQEEPKAYRSANRGYEYTSTQAIASRLIGYMSELKKLGDQVADAKLATAKVLYYPGQPNAVPPDRWVETTDAASGSRYAYYKFKTNEDAYIAVDDVVLLTYRNGNATFTLMADGVNYESFTVFDQNPSADRIHEVGGIPIYHSEGSGEPFLIWRQPARDGELGFVLKSDATIKEQLSFADAVIQATSGER